MRTTLSIEDGLLEEAKILARQRKTTVGEVVNEALRLGLLRSIGQASAPQELPLMTFRGDGLQAGVDLHHSAELLEIMERP
jgi:hypothetical protein